MPETINNSEIKFQYFYYSMLKIVSRGTYFPFFLLSLFNRIVTALAATAPPCDVM